jgi:phenylalanyl-tRNA synthetase beta chain
VDTGDEKLQVVCGAPNTELNQKIIFAKVGAKLADGMKIKKVKLRGVESYGMICSEREMGLSDDHAGIIVLEKDAPIGVAADKYLGLDDAVIKLELTPNRPDMMSAFGIARDVGCLAGKEVRRPGFDLKEISENAAEYIKVSIDDPDACPRYTGRMIKDVKIGISPWWMKQKLLLCGVRPISNIVDITNYVMIEYGHPLHAFDYDLMKRKEIVVRRALAGESFTTLDGNEHKLTPEVLLITDGETAVAAAGVMGGLDSEVGPKTSNVLLEAAYFNPVTIRRGRTKLGIISESSSRFEKGADPNIIPEAIGKAAFLMQKYADGKVLKGIVDCYPTKICPVKIDLRPKRVNYLLGTKLPTERIAGIFKGLDFDVKEKGEMLEVTVPTFQPDITREVDLIEEVARIEGYDAIPAVVHNLGPLFTPLNADDIFRDEIKIALTAQGFDETYSSGMAEPKLLADLTGEKGQLKILNPIAEDLAVLQSSIIYSLLKSVAHNIAHRNINLQLFEDGRAFQPGDSPVEEEKIGLALCGECEGGWYGKPMAFDFYYLKGALDALTDSCHLPSFEYCPENQAPFAEGESFKIRLDDCEIGHCGRIKPDIARKFDIKQTVFAAEIDFASILSRKLPAAKYQPLPRFPSSPRDLAIVVDDSIRAGEILTEIKKTAGPLLERIDIFDLYRGQQLGSGKKSIAFSLRFRSSERSLEADEVAVIQNNIAAHLKQCFNAEIREG